MSEQPCRWDDDMHDASTLGLPYPRPHGYGREVIAYRKELERQLNSRLAEKRKEPR